MIRLLADPVPSIDDDFPLEFPDAECIRVTCLWMRRCSLRQKFPISRYLLSNLWACLQCGGRDRTEISVRRLLLRSEFPMVASTSITFNPNFVEPSDNAAFRRA